MHMQVFANSVINIKWKFIVPSFTVQTDGCPILFWW